MPFFLTSFFFLSGYVYKSGDDFKSFILKKSKTIFVPWAIFSLLDILGRYWFGNENLKFMEYVGLSLLQVKGWHETLWFLPCLFISFIPFYFIVKCTNSRRIMAFSSVMFLISYSYGVFMDPNMLPWKTISLPWHLHMIFICNLFMVLGYLYRNNEKVINDRIHMSKLTKFAWIMVLTYIVVSNVMGEYGLTTYNPNIICWIFIILFGILTVIVLSKKTKESKLLSFIGRNSLLYFCLHIFVVKVMNQLLYKLGFRLLFEDNIVICSIVTILITMIIVLILILPIKFINNRMKFVIGKF